MPKKIHNALFWFTNNNRIDETAINYLKDNDIEKAIEIWQKTLKNEITEKNYSSYANISTLLIGVASVNGNIKKDLLKQGIKLKGKLLNSNSIKSFISEITKNGNISVTDKLNSEFINEILQLVNPYLKNKDLTQRELVSFFSEFPVPIQKSISAKFSETHIFNIEKNIENTVKKRNETPIDAEEHGEALYKNTKKDITELKQIFGANNIQFQMIANKLANEIMQCSIDFFNVHREEDAEFDPGDDALRIAKYANSIGATGQIKNRIIENTQSIQEWVKSKGEREKRKVIEDDIAFIIEQLRLLNETEYEGNDTLSRLLKQKISLFGSNIDKTNLNKADKFLTKCFPKLKKIHNTIGNDEMFLQLSSAVVQNSLSIVVDTINKAQEDVSKTHSQFDRYNAISSLKEIIETSAELIHIMFSLTIYSELKTRLRTNKEVIWNIADQVVASTKSRKDKKEQELRNAKNELIKIKNKQFLESKIRNANYEMDKIKQWQLFRKQETREQQINEQRAKINTLLQNSEQEKRKEIRKQEENIFKIEIELKQL